MLCLHVLRMQFHRCYDSASNTGLICNILKGYVEYYLEKVDEKHCDLMTRVCFTLQTSMREEKEVCD